MRDHPVVLSHSGKLVYSPYDYPYSVFPQAWLEEPDFAAAPPALPDWPAARMLDALTGL